MIGMNAWHWREEHNRCPDAILKSYTQKKACVKGRRLRSPSPAPTAKRQQGLPPFEVDGDWPWNEAFFPKPSAITNQDSQ